MAFAQLNPRSLSLASFPVARAFALSLLIHALLVVTVELGYTAGLWNATLFKPRQELDAETIRALQSRPLEEEMPLVFVDVDPSQEAAEPPKDAKYYSALNSRAANPDPQVETMAPKIQGTQDRVPQTLERRVEPEPVPLAPAPKVAEATPEPAAPEPEPEVKQRTEEGPEDLALAKAPDEPREKLKPKPPERMEPPKAAPPRPRRLADARRQKGIAGERMKQTGGVKRFSMEPSLDVKATPFGSYDAKIIAAIQGRWYNLLDSRDFAANYSGRVVLEFRLNSDGRVTAMKVSENGVTEILALLCQRAVQDPAPFEPWPADLRRIVGREYREVRFTFYYN